MLPPQTEQQVRTARTALLGSSPTNKRLESGSGSRRWLYAGALLLVLVVVVVAVVCVVRARANDNTYAGRETDSHSSSSADVSDQAGASSPVVPNTGVIPSTSSNVTIHIIHRTLKSPPHLPLPLANAGDPTKVMKRRHESDSGSTDGLLSPATSPSNSADKQTKEIVVISGVGLGVIIGATTTVHGKDMIWSQAADQLKADQVVSDFHKSHNSQLTTQLEPDATRNFEVTTHTFNVPRMDANMMLQIETHQADAGLLQDGLNVFEHLPW